MSTVGALDMDQVVKAIDKCKELYLTGLPKIYLKALVLEIPWDR